MQETPLGDLYLLIKQGNKKMKITIIGHNIDIENLEDFDYTKGNDSFIYVINDLILSGGTC